MVRCKEAKKSRARGVLNIHKRSGFFWLTRQIAVLGRPDKPGCCMRSMKFVLWALLAVLLTAISVSSALAAPALRLSPGQERYGLGGYMEVLEDPTNSLTVEEVASGEFSGKFKPVDSDYLNIGYTKSTYWVRFTVDMTGLGSETKWNIDPGWFHYDDLKVYVQKNNDHSANSTCDGLPFELLHNKMRMFKMESVDCGTYYIKFSSIYPLYINTFVKTIDNSVWTHCARLAFFVLLCSIIFVMIVYNSVIFVVIRHSSYLYYVVAYFFRLLFIYVKQWNPVTFDVFDRNISLMAVCLSAAFWCFLATSILDTKIHMPKGDKYLRLLGSIVITFAIAGFFIPRPYYSRGTLVFCVFAWSSCLVSSLVLALRGHKIARLVALAWAAGVGFLFLFAFGLTGFLSLDSMFFPAIAIAIESLLVSMVLAYRFKLINQEYLTTKAVAEAKSAFLASMSHEIRTPLTAILGYADILRNQNLAAEARRYLGNIRIAGTHLLSIINDILDMAKIEAGKIDLEMIEFNLGEMLDKTLKICAPQACVNGNELAVRVEPGLPETVIGDPVRLEQILINLVSNAAKFTTNGDILVRVHDVGSGAGQPEEAIVLGIDVRDTGIGIPADKQDSLFQTFSQAGSATTRKFGGTGLGLAISRKLVNLMGGDLTFTSQEGKGSTFTATAVLGRGLAVPEKKSLPLPANGKALVIDDNAMAREALTDVLMQLGLVPLVVGSCASAQGMVRRMQGICLVMVDGEMLHGDFALVEQLFAGGLAAETPLVMMENALDSEAAGIVSERISRRITKPVTVTRLFGALLEVFEPQAGEQEGLPAENHFDMLQGRHALVVDDNEFNVEVIGELLSQAGVEVVACYSGAAALEKLGRGLKVDVVLMDVEMPEMNGYETTRRIRGELGLVDLPVIALTANAFREIQGKCLASGMNDCLTKPVDTKMLYKKLVEWT